MDNSERNLYIVTNIYRAKFGGLLEALGANPDQNVS